MVLTEAIGWVATVFRGWGMLVKSATLVKYLVSIGNLFWMINGILTGNVPLIASNGICLGIMAIDLIRERYGKRSGI